MEKHGDYSPPAITEIAGLQELTLDIDKYYAPLSDGITYQFQPVNVPVVNPNS